MMSINVNENIPNEIHDVDQFIRIENGNALVIINNKDKYELKDGDIIMIPKQTYHEIKNIGKNKLKLYTIYSPPEHYEDELKRYKAKYKKYKKKYLQK